MDRHIHYPTAELKADLKYLELLSRSFPTIASASTEIINLEAILNLPKGTEHFLTDIHGEYEAFQHVLKNASGTVKRKVNEIFGTTLREAEKKDLCTLIYYPREKLKLVKQHEKDICEWYEIMLNRLVKVCQSVSSKYTRSKVNKALPKDFSYIIQELLHETEADPNKQDYFKQIISTIISTRRADDFIAAMCELIQRLAIDRLHVIGDIYDRGPGAHIIMDTICAYHDYDIQWGNHDILWMGAYAGNDASIANAVRIALRYGNVETLEEGYAINLLPLATFAMETYKNVDPDIYKPRIKDAGRMYSEYEKAIMAGMHKAIAIIQWKLEGQIIERHPDYKMDDRLLLNKIDYIRGTITLDGTEYQLKDTDFPTIDPANPYRLTDKESQIVGLLHNSFVNSERLGRHIECLLSHGSLYLSCNNNLMFHASIPMNADASFKDVTVDGEKFSGKRLLDRLDTLVRLACRGADEPDRNYAIDYMWYLWCGPDSPLFDKSKMTTFERYLIDDPKTHTEPRGNYYTLADQPEVCDKILAEFGLPTEDSHIINGHVPVRTLKGENPVKAGGKRLVIDGGFSKAYQPRTGIAGYTLVYHSRGFQLVEHEPFESQIKAIEEGLDIVSNTVVSEHKSDRMRVRDTDKGRELARQIVDLNKLLAAYRRGLIKERN
ncbi:MAG: fructose-1,6-bisphosphatase [Muribaculaceae bacterium]